MRDLQYLNSIYESLDEGIGIKTTKLKKYYDAASGYESQRNPASMHTELSDPRRRAIRYDYGKASYEEISAADAIRLVKEDKTNIQKLRIIYRLDDAESLVEYELRDNGNVYAIYGSTRPVEIDGRNYKNIRYAPWKKVLENADLIYITDEYDRYIEADPEVAKKRADKSSFAQLPLPAERDADGFDRHNIYANIYTAGDTSSYRAPKRLVSRSIDTGAHKVAARYNPEVAHTIEPYLIALNTVKKKYEQLDRYRRALRKLESDKEELDTAEYDKKKARWESAYQSALEDYHREIEEFKKVEAKVDKTIDERSAQFAEKLRRNVKDYDEALRKGFQLQNRLQELTSQVQGDLATGAIGDSYDLNRAKTRLINAASAIQNAKRHLEELLRDMSDDRTRIQDAENEVIACAEVFDSALTQVDELKLQDLERQFKTIDDVAKQLRDIDTELAVLRPKAAAAKAARAAKNKAPELDPELVDIIEFEDDEDILDDND